MLEYKPFKKTNAWVWWQASYLEINVSQKLVVHETSTLCMHMQLLPLLCPFFFFFFFLLSFSQFAMTFPFCKESILICFNFQHLKSDQNFEFKLNQGSFIVKDPLIVQWQFVPRKIKLIKDNLPIILSILFCVFSCFQFILFLNNLCLQYDAHFFYDVMVLTIISFM